MDVKYDIDISHYDPNRTQRLKVEIERVGDTDKHRSQELLMHIIENLEAGVSECRGSIEAVQKLAGKMLNKHEVDYEHVTEERIKNLIAGALAVDAQTRREASKRYYGRIFWRIIVPAAGALGTGLGSLIETLLLHRGAGH